jgi:guanylate kinase
MKKKALLIVISSPSGAGKTTVCQRILKKNPEYLYSISYTTRKKRESEKDGEDYNFLSFKKFKDKIKRKELVEWAEVYGNYYGTSKKIIGKAQKEGKVLLMVLDIQGGMAIKRKYAESVLIFILPPNMKELERRLKRRATDKGKDLKKRMDNVFKEISFLPYYDYVVVNKNLQDTIKIVDQIINAEKYKSKRFDFRPALGRAKVS